MDTSDTAISVSAEFFDFVAGELESVLERWHEHRAARSDEGGAGDSGNSTESTKNTDS